MGSVNISIKEEAYEFLKSMKGKEKSFSDVILEFRKKNDLSRYYGALKDVNWNEREKNMKALRKDFEERL